MRWLERVEEGLVALLMAAMTLTAFAQVVARYAFNYSFVWALELNGMLFAWLIFIGMSYGVRVGAHIGIDVLVRTLGPRTSRAVGLVAVLLCVVYALIVAVGGWHYVRKMYDVGIEMQDLPMPQWLPRTILPLGFALLALRFAQAFVRLARGEKTKLLNDEAQEALQQGELRE